MFAAVCTTPPLTTAGNPQPTEPCHPASRTTSTAVPTIASGVAGFGVLILTLSSRSSPDAVSTGAPLIPDPPTSIPNTFMRPPQTETAFILYDCIPVFELRFLSFPTHRGLRNPLCRFPVFIQAPVARIEGYSGRYGGTSAWRGPIGSSSSRRDCGGMSHQSIRSAVPSSSVSSVPIVLLRMHWSSALLLCDDSY